MYSLDFLSSCLTFFFVDLSASIYFLVGSRSTGLLETAGAMVSTFS